MANYGMVSWDESKGANICTVCGNATYGFKKTGGYENCVECTKVGLMEEQNQLLRDRQTQPSTVSDSGELSPLKAAFVLSVIRLLVVFLAWNWLLPKKVDDAAMLLAVGSVLAIDMFLPDLSEFTALSSKERIVHWVLFVASAWTLISKLFGH